MSIEEKLARYNEIHAKRRLLGRDDHDPVLDRESIQLMLDIETTHTLYAGSDHIYYVRQGRAPRLYLGPNWRELGKE